MTHYLALQGGAFTQHKRHFVLTGSEPVVLSEGSPLEKEKKEKVFYWEESLS